MNEGRLRIGEVARLAGVSRRTVDFYTRVGILQPAERTKGNYRLYEPDSVDRILLVRRLENQGVPLAEVAAALSRRGGRPQDVSAALEVLDREVHALRKAVKALPAVGGLAPTGALSTLTDRIRSLVETALEITGGAAPPGL